MNERTACIVLPTYNEARNIRKTLRSILAQKSPHFQIHVLVVDDSSPDGTAQLVEKMKHPRTHLYVRKEKQGLGAAYIAGFLHAHKKLKPAVIMEMDADGQHNPKDIPRLLAKIHEGADFVIGSRYVKGGRVPNHWGWHRKLISRSANLYAKITLDLTGVKDCTGGFRAIRSSTLKKVSLATLETGYAFQVVLLDACIRKGALVKEVPISFLERRAGASKMRLKDMVAGGFGLAKVRIARLLQW